MTNRRYLQRINRVLLAADPMFLLLSLKAVIKLFRKVFARLLKAHTAKGRRSVTLAYLLGEERLMDDFLADVSFRQMHLVPS